jgi:hypothetical protein
MKGLKTRRFSTVLSIDLVESIVLGLFASAFLVWSLSGRGYGGQLPVLLVAWPLFAFALYSTRWCKAF